MSDILSLAPQTNADINDTFLAGLNPAQQAAVTQPAHSAVQVLAGAGTGKTELISRRFVKIVRELKAAGIARPEERILVVTFTDDAASEMRERIHRQLVANGEEGLTPQCWIGTFHQFANRLLRAHALEAGLPPDFGIINTLQQHVLFNRLTRGLVNGDYADVSGVLARYGLDQVRGDILSLDFIRESGFDGLEDLFGADRLYGMIGKIKATGLAPAQFLQTATGQTLRLSEALKQLPTPYDPELPSVDNIQNMLESWRLALKGWAYDGWDPLARRIEIAEAKGEKLSASKYFELMKFIGRYYVVSQGAKKGYVPIHPDFDDLDAATQSELVLIQWVAAIYALYQDTLLAQGACDFDDLMNHVIHLLETQAPLRARYRQYFESIIVDEFQDSNGSQLRLLELLMRKDPPNITVVGDEKQSIYGFRYAQPENMDLIFRAVPYEKIALQTNYRSRPPILAVANRLTRTLTADAFQQLNPSDANALQMEPKVTWLNLNAQDEVEKKGEVAYTDKSMDEQRWREAQFIAGEIADLIREGNYTFRDIAVLVKSHDKAENIQTLLTRYGIPSVRRKNLGFFQEPVIKDSMALLRLMQNLNDDLSFVRILQGKLNLKQLKDLAELRGRTESFFEVALRLPQLEASATPLPSQVREAVYSLASELLAIRKMQPRMSPIQLFLKLLTVVPLIPPDLDAAGEKHQRASLRTFEKMMVLFSQNRPLQPTLAEVIETLTQYAENAKEELPVSEEMDGANAVQLMTFYASKGLQYPVVFVAFADQHRARADDGFLLFDPQYEGKNGFGLMLGRQNDAATAKRELYNKAWLAPRAEAEARRVFYVALTRPQEKLYVIRCNQSPDWTHPDEYLNPSMTVLDAARDEAALTEKYWERDEEATLAAMQAYIEARTRSGQK